MSDDVTTSATIASLLAEVERLKAELQGERDDLAACYKAKAALIDERNDACEGSGCWSAKDLRQALDERRAYAERLIAENVQLTNRQTMDREEIESMGRRNDELTKALWTSAEYVKRLESDVARLANDKRGLLDEMDELADEDDRADSLINSIITACTGSGCLNAHELRAALDTARERAGVLEAEVRAWHAAENLRRDEWHSEFQALVEARWNTSRTHALDAAKFGGGQ